MVISEQAELAELTNRMMGLEKVNAQLKQYFRSCRSNETTNVPSSQDLGHSDVDLSLDNTLKEKRRLEDKLYATETKLFATVNTLAHFELKLTVAEHERDGRCAEIARLRATISA